jgi:hypothetical protein
MNSQDRKRGYSQAFQLAMSANSTSKAPKSMSTPLEFVTPAWIDENKENHVSSSGSKGGLPMTPSTLQTVFHLPDHPLPFATQAPKKLPLRGHPLQPLPNQQYNGSQTPGKILPNFVTDQYNLDQLLNSESPFDDVLGAYLDTEPGPTIYEDQDPAMSALLLFDDPPTPSVLGFQDLTLLDLSKNPVPEVALHPVARQNRTSVHITPSMQWTE